MSFSDLRAPDGISRRDFARLLAGAGAATVLGSMCPSLVRSALADSGGGSSGGGHSSGSIWGGNYLENSLIWYDRGGFVDNDNYDPNQIKVREDSVQLFWQMMKAEVRSRSGLEPRSDESAMWGGYITDYILGRLRAAISEVESRERALYPNEDPKGRIVAVGWVWGDFSDGWQLATDLVDSSRQTYNGIIYRKGTASELPRVYGWDTQVDRSGSLQNGMTWRDAIYDMGRRQFTGGDYSIIILAVTDTMVVRSGWMKVQKNTGM